MPTNAEKIRARDEKVIAAAWRLIHAGGDRALTLRSVAEEAGVAITSMIYTLPTLDVVRERALEQVGASIRDRVEALSLPDEDGVERAMTWLCVVLPLDEERRTECSVLQVVGSQALTQDLFVPVWREVDGTIRDVCARALREVGVRGDVVALDRVHALVDGLRGQLMNRGPERSPQWALTVLERELRRLALHT